ncbi:hypothetical protein CTI12_AA629540 [Artemisia annua]|uniref:Uncharacterized protein n=1 Tax=Artemisia annua TaxID=35608 RepID=A0A2U1K999_ARTAN|nr:hypothetical protein CTI12_AA629540 [Artemisia annua]
MNVIASRDGDDRTTAELYEALSKGEDMKVFEICRYISNGPFHIVTIHNDTVLHMASFNKRNNLVVALLRSLPESHFDKLTWVNSGGSTILHEASENNGTVEAAREMLLRAPSLLTMTNKRGETALFHAARYGKTKIFRFLCEEVERAVRKGADLMTFLFRNDKATILHPFSITMNVIASRDGDDRTTAELYEALSKGEDMKVFEICRYISNGPFHIVTIHNDTVLHMASFNKRNNLVVALLRSLPESHFDKLTWVNSGGSTILHEASENNGTVEAAREMLLRAPSLLTMTNKRGETALFHAARYGKTKIFRFLCEEVERAVRKGADLMTFLFRNDKATILHVAILSQNFDLAILITDKYPRLIAETDGNGMTSLQLLAVNPSAFDEGVGNNFLKRFIYNCKNIL